MHLKLSELQFYELLYCVLMHCVLMHCSHAYSSFSNAFCSVVYLFFLMPHMQLTLFVFIWFIENKDYYCEIAYFVYIIEVTY